MQYFGEKFDAKLCNGTCDNCKNKATVETMDVTPYVLSLLKIR